jgi:hypothetical protein
MTADMHLCNGQAITGGGLVHRRPCPVHGPASTERELRDAAYAERGNVDPDFEPQLIKPWRPKSERREATERTYTGVITVRDYGNSTDVLFLVADEDVHGDEPRPLALRIADDLERYGSRVDVAYWVADGAASLDELQGRWLRHVLGGELEAEFRVAYSEITGYLWTDESIVVGGHDLLAELTDRAELYVHLQITFHSDAAPEGAS